MNSFWEGFEKAAAGNPEGHHGRRFLLGNPISTAIEAEPGKKMQGFGEAFKHQTIQGLKGMGIGGVGGAGLGAAAGALASLAKSKRIDPEAVKLLAALGAGGGSYLGGAIGSMVGQHGRKASEIHGRYSPRRIKED
jgi:hypothetical protein